MTIMRDLIADTRRIVYGSMADQLNFLDADYPIGDAQLFMKLDVTNITPGMVLSSGLNVWYVMGTEAEPKRVLVVPAYDNSHNDALSAGAPVMIRPRVTDWLLFRYLNDQLKALSSPTYGLYRQGSWEDENLNPVWGVYPIPAEALTATNLIRVQVKYWTSTDLWTDVDMNYVDWQPERQSVRIKGNIPGGTPIRFDYKAPFLPAPGLMADVEVDCGVPESMHDIPPLGAAIRLLRTTENRRGQTHSQSDPRRADEVAQGGNSSAAADLNREYRQRINDEAIRLTNRNPYVRFMP